MQSLLQTLSKGFDILGSDISPRFDKAASIKTMRKLQYNGYRVDRHKPFDFEWPTPADLEAMPDDGAPIKVESLQWSKNQIYQDNYIGALRLRLANGKQSPLFLAKNHPAPEQLNVVDLKDAIAVVKGTYD